MKAKTSTKKNASYRFAASTKEAISRQFHRCRAIGRECTQEEFVEALILTGLANRDGYQKRLPKAKSS